MAETERLLTAGWQRVSVQPGTASDPSGLPENGWGAATVPGTVIADGLEPSDAIGRDHWYRCQFAATPVDLGTRVRLCFDGLATLAEVWFNGKSVLQSDNMFCPQFCDVGAFLSQNNEIAIRFRSLGEALQRKRPRGRWPTRLVSEKNLRFFRTTFLGFMPGWFPPSHPVGPWRAIRLVQEQLIAIEARSVQTELIDNDGRVRLKMRCRCLGSESITAATFELEPDRRFMLEVSALGDGIFELNGVLDIGGVKAWWPHTHGTQHLYQPLVRISCDRNEVVVPLDSIGFRRIERTAPAGVGFGMRVNGVGVFCRGAVWTPLDPKRLDAEPNDYEEALQLVKSAGLNLLRISGITTYENDLFYRLCDEYGILVWQDFMFANFDYPVDDPVFLQSCRREAESFLERTETRVSLAVLCGNSEMQQQAAMMGLEADAWSSTLFDVVLPEACKARRPDLLYVVSSPSGGDLPFHVDRGPGHYYGVGAYQRPLEDVYAASVRFASECLAFAQPPEASELRRLFADAPIDTTDSRYRAGIPRDPGANWDFSDVTDHYVGTVFGAPARALATTKPERYLELARVSTGRVMAHVFGIWRRAEDPCEGGVVFTLRDVLPGAGWGLISNTGMPKSSYYFLKRILTPRAMWFVDGGVNGLRLHVANDTASVLSGRLTVRLCRDDGHVIEQAAMDVLVAPHAQSAFGVDRCLGRFTDANRAYRFGPAEHAVVTAVLEGAFPLHAEFLPNLGCEPSLRGDLELSAELVRTGERSARVTLRSNFLAESVVLSVPGYLPSDNYVHVLAREPLSIELTALRDGVSPIGTVKAMNGAASVAMVSMPAPEQGHSL